MKKLTILSLFILLLAACSTNQDASPNENDEQEEQTEGATETQVDNETEEETDTDVEEPVEEEAETPEEDENTANGSEEDESGDSEDNEDLVDLTYAIFEAQNKKDYEFLESILSKGSSLNKENDTFTFENVDSPHEQEFLTDDNTGELESRYTHENESGSVIVGFAAIDYEKEYSFVIDFEFIREDDKWKMNDMDINK